MRVPLSSLGVVGFVNGCKSLSIRGPMDSAALSVKRECPDARGDQRGRESYPPWEARYWRFADLPESLHPKMVKAWEAAVFFGWSLKFQPSESGRVEWDHAESILLARSEVVIIPDLAHQSKEIAEFRSRGRESTQSLRVDWQREEDDGRNHVE